MLPLLLKFYPRNIVYSLYPYMLWNKIKNNTLPNHLAIITDGNRRWADSKHLVRKEGHEFGVEKLKEILKWVWNSGIEILTIFAFSNENFSRPEEEVSKLMDLFSKNFLVLAETPEIHKYKIKIKAIGRINSLPIDVQNAIHIAENASKNNNNRLLQVAVGYGGRIELMDAIIGIINDKILPEQVNEEMIHEYLYTCGIKDPDLIIRTSGEERLSGFLIWQSAYSELYFADVYFPEFFQDLSL